MEELENELVVAELDQGRDLGMSEGGGVRSADDRAQVFAGEFVGGYVEREDGDGEVDEGVGFPFVLPVGGQSRDALWDVEAAVGREASQDGLDRAGRGHQTSEHRGAGQRGNGIDLFKGEQIGPASSRKILHRIEYQHNLFGFSHFINSAMKVCLHHIHSDSDQRYRSSAAQYMTIYTLPPCDRSEQPRSSSLPLPFCFSVARPCYLKEDFPPFCMRAYFWHLLLSLSLRDDNPTERGEFLPSLSVMSLPEASQPQQRASLLWDNVFHHNDFFL